MSMIPDTFDGLVSAVKSLAEDDSQEFERYIPTAIHLAEQRLVKELDTEGLHHTASIVGTASSNILEKPSGYLFSYDLNYRVSNINSERKFVTKKSDDYVKEYWPVGRTSTDEYPHGLPKYYADLNNTQFIVAPAMNENYVFTLEYSKQVSALSSTVQSNYYTEFVSDALFYATMSNMAEFMKDYEVQPIWENKYNRAMETKNNEGRRARRDDGTSPQSPERSRNTLRGDN